MLPSAQDSRDPPQGHLLPGPGRPRRFFSFVLRVWVSVFGHLLCQKPVTGTVAPWEPEARVPASPWLRTLPKRRVPLCAQSQADGEVASVSPTEAACGARGREQAAHCAGLRQRQEGPGGARTQKPRWTQSGDESKKEGQSSPLIRGGHIPRQTPSAAPKPQVVPNRMFSLSIPPYDGV